MYTQFLAKQVVKRNIAHTFDKYERTKMDIFVKSTFIMIFNINYDRMTASCWFFGQKYEFEIARFRKKNINVKSRKQGIHSLYALIISKHSEYFTFFSPHIERWDKYTTSCTWVIIKNIEIGLINKELLSLLLEIC